MWQRCLVVSNVGILMTFNGSQGNPGMDLRQTLDQIFPHKSVNRWFTQYLFISTIVFQELLCQISRSLWPKFLLHLVV